jgi:DNA polymerase-3 subunit delta'
VKVPTIDREELTKGLEQRAQLPYEQAFQIASVADGNYREALQLLQHADEDWQSLLRDWLNAVLKNGPLAQYKWVEEVAKLGREKQKQFLRYFNHLLEQSVRLKLIGERLDSKGRPQVVMPANELDFANRLNKIVDISQIQSLAALLDDATYHIERNANAKILFHALTIKLYHIIADKSLILTGGER